MTALDRFLTGMNPGQVALLVALIALVLFAIWWLTNYALACAESRCTTEAERRHIDDQRLAERRRQLGVCVDLRTWKSGVRQ